MDGVATLRLTRRALPDLPAIALTGYPEYLTGLLAALTLVILVERTGVAAQCTKTCACGNLVCGGEGCSCSTFSQLAWLRVVPMEP
jgi:hypothetical protein